MASDLAWALLGFVVVTLFTPGPNNTMLMSSGLNFGFRRGLPHLWGVALGFTVMVLAVGLGLGAVFQAYPTLYTVLKYAGAAYLLYLAWQIATAGAPDARARCEWQVERPADHVPRRRRLPVAQSESLGDGGRCHIHLCGRCGVSAQRAADRLSVRHARHRVERDLARLWHEPQAAAQEPAHRARRPHRYGRAAGRLALAYPRRRLALTN